MPYKITPKEITAVSALAPTGRLEHFVKRVADWEEMWSLKNQNGWALSSTSGGREVAPLWPHPEYAKTCATGSWGDFAPALVELRDFLTRWVPSLENGNRLVAVFPTASSAGVLLEASNLASAITEEIQENYGRED